MKTMQQLRELAIVKCKKAPLRVAVAAAADQEVLQTIKMVNEMGMGGAILFGNTTEINTMAKQIGLSHDINEIRHTDSYEEAATAAVACVKKQEAAVLMKGNLLTPIYLKAVLNNETGLKKGKLLHLGTLLAIPGTDRLVLASDMGMVIQPTLAEKIEMIQNLTTAMIALGIENPKIACLAAIETVSNKMPDTEEAAILSKMAGRGQIKNAIVDGPLSFDLAVYPEALRHKKIDSPVAGAADILLFPNIQAGNMVYKALVHSTNTQSGTVVFGTSAPVIMSSRSDSAESKLNSLALAMLLA